MLRHGLDVAEMVKSELPGTPNAVWTVKLRESGMLIFEGESRSVLDVNLLF